MNRIWVIFITFLICAGGVTPGYAQLIFADGFDNLVTVNPSYYDHALKNPMKGFADSPDH